MLKGCADLLIENPTGEDAGLARRNPLYQWSRPTTNGRTAKADDGRWETTRLAVMANSRSFGATLQPANRDSFWHYEALQRDVVTCRLAANLAAKASGNK
jgi:hypothetical protein